MSKQAFMELREMLCKELDQLARKGEISTGGLDVIHKLTDTIKNLDKIMMLEEGGHSYGGEWEADMRGSYSDGSSYARRGEHYVRGHYSRDGYSRNDGGSYDSGGSYDDGGSYRGYSRQSEKEHMMDKLEDMLRDARSDEEKRAIQKCMKHLDR